MSESRPVYSTSGDNHCPRCGKPIRKCRCKIVDKYPPSHDGVIRIGRETKGRKGSGVTVISGLQVSDEELKLLAKKLKTLCSSGGTIKRGIIEIQGDHRLKAKQYLEQQFDNIKLAGG